MIQLKNKNILNCFTCEKLVFKYSSIQHLNYKLNAFCIPFWKEFAIYYFDYHMTLSDLSISKTVHEYIKNLEKKGDFRISSPWIMKTNKDCYFCLTPGSCLKNDESNIKINSTSNIYNYKNYFNSHIDISFKISNNTESKLVLNLGQPFAYGLSFSNEKLVIKNHLIPEKEYIEMRKEGKKNKSKIEFTQLMDNYINESKTN